MYLTLTFYISLDGATEGIHFFGISHGDVIGYRSRFDNMHNEEVEPFVFCFIYANFD